MLDTPTKNKDKKGKGKQRANRSDDDDAFDLSEIDESDGRSTASVAASDDLDLALAGELAKQQKKKKKSRYVDAQRMRGSSPSMHPPLSPIQNRLSLVEEPVCGLCGTEHRNRPCYMTESSENLAEYRRILTTMDSDEPIEERVSCFVNITLC